MKKLILILILLGQVTLRSQTVSFTVSRDTVCYEDNVELINMSTGTIDSLRWIVNGLQWGSVHSDSIGALLSVQGNNLITLYVYRSGHIDSASNFVYVRPLVYLPTLVDSSGVLISNPDALYDVWYFNGTIIPTAVEKRLPTHMFGCYYALVDTSAGCIMGITDTLCITSVSVNSIVPEGLSIEIYPDPVISSLTIAAPAMRSMVIHDATGRTVYSRECNSDREEVDVSDLPPGIYFIRINGTEVRRFVKE